MYKIEPKISVNNISFGCDIRSLIDAGYVEDAEAFDEITGWKTYRKNDEIDFYISNGVVICAACFKNCSIGRVEIIGETSVDLITNFGDPDEIGEAVWVSNDRQQIPYEYFELGLQFWLESGKVVSVFCNAIY